MQSEVGAAQTQLNVAFHRILDVDLYGGKLGERAGGCVTPRVVWCGVVRCVEVCSAQCFCKKQALPHQHTDTSFAP